MLLSLFFEHSATAAQIKNIFKTCLKTFEFGPPIW